MSYNENKRKKIQTKMILNSINKFNGHPKSDSKEYTHIAKNNEFSLNNQKDLNHPSNNTDNNFNSSNQIQNCNENSNSETKIRNNQDMKELYSPEDITKNISINEKNNQSDKIKSLNHEIISSCINDCITWTLKAYVNNKKTNKKDFKSNYVFRGKNIFFPILEFSVLNAFNNSLCFDKCFPKHKNNFENKKKILEKLKQESLRQIKELNTNKIEDNKNLDNASIKNILESNYPIDNNKNNFNIIDNNLCLIDNLNNVFLLQFDLKNNIDKNIDFRLINDNCVGREIDFILNGEIHGNIIFKNDLKFSVTYRDFIKTIQFRLDNFKNKILDYKHNKKYGETSNKNHNYLVQEQNQKIFYGKMINNVNIGIEFLKPQSFDKLQTNFNSIVNSEIELTKIFIELTIPKNLINKNCNNFGKMNNEKNGLNINNNEMKKVEMFITPKKEDEKNKSIMETKLYIPPPPPLIIPSNIPPPPAPPASWANLNFFNMRLDSNGIPLPPPFPNFNKLFYKNEDSSSIRNNLVYNTNKLPNVTFDYLSINNNVHKSPSLSLDPINIYSSPTSAKYSPMSTSYLMMQSMSYYGGMIRHQSISVNSPFNMSNYSSPYIKDNKNIRHLNFNLNRKYSESINHDLFDNLMDTNYNFNSNQQTPNNHIKTGEEPIPILNLNQCISTPNMEKQQNSLNDTDISSNGNQHRKIFPMTIKQRILESYKTNNKDMKDKSKQDGNDNGYNNKNILRELRDSFIMANQGKTNLEIFLESVSPLYKKKTDVPFLKLKIIDIFNKFKPISLFGLKNIYCFNGELIHLSYTLSLSAISIKIINKTLINQIVLELKKKYEVLERYNQLKNEEEIIINILQYIIYFSPDYIQISFAENIPSHLRNPFTKTISDLSKNFPFFNQITIEDIHLIDSLFSILYSPLKCSKPYINYTSFVVYYQFTKEIIQEEKINKDNLEYDKQTITGVLPLKINTNLYFQRIIIYNFVMNTSPLFNYFSPYFNNDTIMIKNMVYSVINDVSRHIRGTSYDYEYFMKLSKHNSINQWK